MSVRGALDRPTFIVSCPRSGSQLLFELLAEQPQLWTIGGESHRIFAAIPELQPARKQYVSGRLDASDANESIALRLALSWLAEARDRDGTTLTAAGANAPRRIRLLEKTPANCLRVAFLERCFPDARFIFLHRDPRPTIASLIEGWLEGARSGRFVTFRDLPWESNERRPWCFFLPPGWREISARPLAEIAAHQWRAANAQILDDLEVLRPDVWTSVSYERLVACPTAELDRLCAFIGVSADERSRAALGRALSPSRTTLTPPDPEKWRRHEREILEALPVVTEVTARLARL